MLKINNKTFDLVDVHNEALTLRFLKENIDISNKNIVQKPIFEEMRKNKTNLLRK